MFAKIVWRPAILITAAQPREQRFRAAYMQKSIVSQPTAQSGDAYLNLGGLTWPVRAGAASPTNQQILRH
eukprot:8874922-Pyramimonas_sp.AAC.1